MKLLYDGNKNQDNLPMEREYDNTTSKELYRSRLIPSCCSDLDAASSEISVEKIREPGRSHDSL